MGRINRRSDRIHDTSAGSSSRDANPSASTPPGPRLGPEPRGPRGAGAPPLRRAPPRTHTRTGATPYAWPAPNQYIVDQHLRGIKTRDDVDRVTGSMLGRSGWRDAIVLLDALSQAGLVPNARHYNDAMTVCRKANQPDEALRLFDEMQQQGVRPDIASYSCAIYSAADAAQPRDPLALYQQMTARSIQPDARCQTDLIVALSKLGRFDEALQVFDGMSGPNLAAFVCAPALAACAGSGRADKAMEIYRRVQAQNAKQDLLPKIQLEAAAYSFLIAACMKGGKKTIVPQLLADAVASGTFKESLGLKELTHKGASELDFHDAAILTHHPAPGTKPIMSKEMAKALLEHHWDTGHIRPDTEFIVGKGEGVICETVTQWLGARGWACEKLPNNPGRLRVTGTDAAAPAGSTSAS